MSETNELSNLRDEFTQHKKDMSGYIETLEELRKLITKDITKDFNRSKEIVDTNTNMIAQSILRIESLSKEIEQCNAKFKSQDKAIGNLAKSIEEIKDNAIGKLEKSIQEIKDDIIKNELEQNTRNLRYVSEIEKGKEDHLSLNKGIASAIDEIKGKVSAKSRKSWFSCTGRSAVKSQNSPSELDASHGGRKRKTVRRSRRRRRRN